MGRQSEREDTFTRPNTSTHTFTRLGAVDVKVEGVREVSDEGPEVITDFHFGLFLAGRH